jgi:hypothetical protein
MNQQPARYQVIDLPPARRELPNLLDVFWWKHTMYGLLEVDVTVPRQVMADHKARTGESLSFTGFLAACLARAVDENKSVQAFLKRGKQLVIFDDVDVAMPVEREIDGARVPVVHVIRGANRKTFAEIHQEIRSVQTRQVSANKGIPPWFRAMMLAPWPFAKLFAALLRAVTSHKPELFVQSGGTVSVTAVGMFGNGVSGWGLTPIAHSLGLVVGSIAQKPAVVAGRVEPREMLNLTIVFDHDIIDGSPATRFVRRLVELIESGYGLAATDETVDGLFSQRAAHLAPAAAAAGGAA